MSDAEAPTCAALRAIELDDLVTCGMRADWWVGNHPTCSDCVATYLRDEGATIVSPIEEPDAVAKLAEAIATNLNAGGWLVEMIKTDEVVPHARRIILATLNADECPHPAWEAKPSGGDPAEPFDVVEVCVACGADRDLMEDRS